MKPKNIYYSTKNYQMNLIGELFEEAFSLTYFIGPDAAMEIKRLMEMETKVNRDELFDSLCCIASTSYCSAEASLT